MYVTQQTWRTRKGTYIWNNEFFEYEPLRQDIKYMFQERNISIIRNHEFFEYEPLRQYINTRRSNKLYISRSNLLVSR